MGDRIYRGIYITTVRQSVTESFVIRQLTKYIQNDPNFKPTDLDKDGIKLERYKVGSIMKNYVVLGINLPYNEVLKRLMGTMLGDTRLTIADVDFGIPRNAGGLINHFDSELHYNLKQAQGFLKKGINIFHTEFWINVLGRPLSIRREILFPKRKREVNIDLLKTIPNVVSYGDQIDDIRQGKGFEIIMLSRLEAMQALAFLNGNEMFYSPAAYFKTDKPCTDFPCKGFGPHGEIIDFQRIVKLYGYVPWEDLNRDIFNLRKLLKEWKSHCMFCGGAYTILGIDADCNWIAATCHCKPEQASYGREKAEFFRLLPGKKHVVNCPDFEPTFNLTDEPLVLYIDGVMPVYDSIEHFQRSAYAAEKVDFHFQECKLSTKFQIGVICSRPERIETHTEMKGNNIIVSERVNVELATTPSSVWSPEGARQMNKINVIPKKLLDSHGIFKPTLWDLKRFMGDGYKANLQKIYTSEGQSIVELIMWQKVEDLVGVDMEYYLVPNSPKSRMLEMQSAVREWKTWRDYARRHADPSKGTILMARRLDRLHYTKKSKQVWEIIIHTKRIDRMNNFAMDLPHIYFGIDIDFVQPKGDDSFVSRCTGRVTRIVDLTSRGEPGMVKIMAIMLTTRPTFIPKNVEVLFVFWRLLYNIFTPIDDWVENDDRIVKWEDNVEQQGVDHYELELYDKPDWVILDSLDIQDIIHSIRNYPIPKNMELCNYLLKDVPPPEVIVVPGGIEKPSKNPKLAEFDYRGYVNDSQKDAIDGMMASRISSCQGSAGCGKTLMAAVAAVHVKKMAESRGLVICVCPPNKAANRFYEALDDLNKKAELGLKIVRMMANALEESEQNTSKYQFLHHMIRAHPDYTCSNYINQLLEEKEESRCMLTREDEKLIVQHTTSIMDKILRETDIVVATIYAATDSRLNYFFRRNSDFRPLAVIVDEANIVTMGSTLTLLGLNPNKLWLVGDHLQLFPMQNSYTAQVACNNVCWMKFLTTKPYLEKTHAQTFLTEQYRMREDLCELNSEWIYNGRVKTAEMVKDRPTHPMNKRFYKAFPWLNDPTRHFYRITYRSREYEKRLEMSYINEKEARIVLSILSKMRRSLVSMTDVVVLCTYVAQVKYLLEDMEMAQDNPEVTVCTVDSYEGRESPIVILSMVRHNDYHGVGFLKAPERLNVAVTRARDYLFFISSEETFRNCEVHGGPITEFYAKMDEKGIKIHYM